MNTIWLGVCCFVAGLLLLPAFELLYLRYGPVPVTVSNSPLPFEKRITHIALHARIDRDMPAHSPVTASPEVLAAGAVVYQGQCAMCHGVPGHASEMAVQMFPSPPQLWVTHHPGVVGVSDDPAGETYWKVKNGIRLSGMPAFDHVLNEQQMWVVSLLLSQAAQPLSEPVLDELTPR